MSSRWQNEHRILTSVYLSYVIESCECVGVFIRAYTYSAEYTHIKNKFKKYMNIHLFTLDPPTPTRMPSVNRIRTTQLPHDADTHTNIYVKHSCAPHLTKRFPEQTILPLLEVEGALEGNSYIYTYIYIFVPPLSP